MHIFVHEQEELLEPQPTHHVRTLLQYLQRWIRLQFQQQLVYVGLGEVAQCSHSSLLELLLNLPQSHLGT